MFLCTVVDSFEHCVCIQIGGALIKVLGRAGLNLPLPHSNGKKTSLETSITSSSQVNMASRGPAVHEPVFNLDKCKLGIQRPVRF